MRLKRATPAADTQVMILPARAPLEPHETPLRALHLSLNGPVVTLESFPSGPARAAVAVHAEGATLCVRSLRTGQVRFFTTTRALAGDRRVAADAALSFAESMGFLFDDDEVAARGDRGAEIATARWRELCGEAAAPPETGRERRPEPRVRPPAPVAAVPVAAPEPEILLDEPWERSAPAAPAIPAPALDAAVPHDTRAPQPIEPPVRPSPPPGLLLSKFRRRPAPEPRPDASEGALPGPRLRLMSRF